MNDIDIRALALAAAQHALGENVFTARSLIIAASEIEEYLIRGIQFDSVPEESGDEIG